MASVITEVAHFAKVELVLLGHQIDSNLVQLFPSLATLPIRSPSSLLFTLVVVFAVSRIGSEFAAWKTERGVPVQLGCPEQARPGWKGEILDAPAIMCKDKPGKIICYDPATAYLIGEVEADTGETIRAKIARAKAAQPAWAQSSFAARRKVLRTIRDWVLGDADAIARVVCRDTGKTAIDAALGDLFTTCSKLAWTIDNGERVLRTETRPNNLLLVHKVCQVRHEPMGVVAACVSWNYPAHNLLGPIISSLFAGNAIVVKASELVAWSASYVVLAVRHCLRAAGADPELVQLVICFPADADALTTSPDIAHMTFIGSEDVGRKVAIAATKELTPVTLELGGKDPAILTKSADLNFFASTLMRSCFGGAGQNCIGLERFIVDEAIVGKLLAILQPRIEALEVGSFLDDTRFGKGQAEGQVDVGPMITDARFGRLEELIAAAVAGGATVHVGGRRHCHAIWRRGHYFAPTLLSGVTATMEIAQEEVFAPILLVMAYPTGDIDAAIALANSTRYALGASVFTADATEAAHISAHLRAGMVNINDFAVSYLNQGLPFGGVRKSGYGRFGGPEGLTALTTPKAVTRDRFFSTLHTFIPSPIDYPLANPAKSWAFAHGLLHLVYGAPLQKLAGIWRLLSASF